MKDNKPRLLATVNSQMPSLLRAQKLQDKAATVGFDWPNIQPVIEKVREEVDEFAHALEHEQLEAAIEELGDILFVCANLARHLGVDAEVLMQQANAKFERRFNGVEAKVMATGRSWESFTLEELDGFWGEVKTTE